MFNIPIFSHYGIKSIRNKSARQAKHGITSNYIYCVKVEIIYKKCLAFYLYEKLRQAVRSVNMILTSDKVSVTNSLFDLEKCAPRNTTVLAFFKKFRGNVSFKDK